MKILVNNAIALAVHALIVALTWSEPYVLSRTVLMVVALVLYLTCGFFLKPEKRHLFLSVVSVASILLIAFLVVIFFSRGDSQFAFYLNVNPIAKLIFPLSGDVPATLYDKP